MSDVPVSIAYETPDQRGEIHYESAGLRGRSENEASAPGHTAVNLAGALAPFAYRPSMLTVQYDLMYL